MVKEGDMVEEKQPLAVVEAMKMENQINCPASGTIKLINFAVGDQVNTTNPIIELELTEPA
jgi:biotin carboxyl carrier protein